jgi:TetR/AcrR family tetracycline transcriptional repressor
MRLQRGETPTQAKLQRMETREKIEEHKHAIRDLQRQHRERQFGVNREEQKQKIIKAALKVLDNEGLEGVTLRKLAGSVDMRAPALYWYFDNKTTLIDYMAEAILQQEFKGLRPRSGEEAWQDWLAEICQRLRNAMRAHRDGSRVVAGAHLYPAETLLKILETALESLISAGVEESRANLIILAAVHFTFGRVIEEQSNPDEKDFEKIDMAEHFKSYPLVAKNAKTSMDALKNGYDDFQDSLRLIIGYA